MLGLKRDLNLKDSFDTNGLHISITTSKLPINEFCTDYDESCIYESLVTIKPTVGDENKEYEFYVRYKNRKDAERGHRMLVELFKKIEPDDIINIQIIKRASINSDKIDELVKQELNNIEAYLRH